MQTRKRAHKTNSDNETNDPEQMATFKRESELVREDLYAHFGLNHKQCRQSNQSDSISQPHFGWLTRALTQSVRRV